MIAGGYSISWDTGSILSTIDVYDLVSNRWSIAHLSEARGYISAVTAKDKSYFAGGLSATTFSNTIDIYDKATNSWSVSQLKYVSGIVSGVLASDKIYWAGTGCNVEIWDVITGTSTRALLSKPRADRGFLYGDHVVLRNGSVAFLRGGLNFFDIFNIAAGTWVVGVLPEALPSNAAVICVNNIIYVAGGRDMNTATDQVYTLEF
jgi:hypothetical protein